MDRSRPLPRMPRVLRRVAVVALLALLVAAFCWVLPRGLLVDANALEIRTVYAGQFRDELLLRANVQAQQSLMLDAAEGGRVEHVWVRDGDIVSAGQLLFQLSNAPLQQSVLARSADYAQQLANLSSLRAALAVSRAGYRQRIADAAEALGRAQRHYQRELRLAEAGFVSALALEEAAAAMHFAQRRRDEAQADARAEERTRLAAIAQMDAALRGLQRGLDLVHRSLEGLVVRAPQSGRLSEFRLELGAQLKAGERLGRIDSAKQFKLRARIDEYYLARCRPGIEGRAQIGTHRVALRLAQLSAQVSEGRFEAELAFTQPPPPGLQPGQSVETHLTLGQPSAALLLADGSFYADSGGQWVYVLARDGATAQRRAVSLGRRAAGQIEVLAGLAPGEQVITSSYQRFGQADRLRLQR